MTDPHTYSRNEVVDRLTTRAWREPAFRSLLFRDAQAALLSEIGEVPDGFDNVVFRPQEIDRAHVRTTSEGRHLVVRPKRSGEPLSVVTRMVLGVPELIIVFYTRRCRYQCSFCTLPLASAYTDVASSAVHHQLRRALYFARDMLDDIRQVSLGNEGSILDEITFPREQLKQVLLECSTLPAVEDLVLETRAEFVSGQVLDEILEWIFPKRLTLKIGLESANDEIRQRVLRKKMDLEHFEAVVELLGKKGVGLASYVLVKAEPTHSDEQGRADAIETCRYLKQLCRDSGTNLTLRINAMYRAANSLWATWAEAQGWVPPSIFDLAEVMLDAVDDDIRVFAGLSEEGLATPDGHYEMRPDFEQWALDALERYNATGDVGLLRRVATHRKRPSHGEPA